MPSRWQAVHCCRRPPAGLALSLPLLGVGLGTRSLWTLPLFALGMAIFQPRSLTSLISDAAATAFLAVVLLDFCRVHERVAAYLTEPSLVPHGYSVLSPCHQDGPASRWCPPAWLALACPSCLVWNMAHGLNGPGVNRPWRSLFLEGLKHAAASTQSVVREPLVPLLNGDG
eukprot:gene19520-23077_t